MVAVKDLATAPTALLCALVGTLPHHCCHVLSMASAGGDRALSWMEVSVTACLSDVPCNQA